MGDAVALRLPALRRLHTLIGRLNADRDLASTLQAVVDGVVEGLGFGVAVVNLVGDDGRVEVVAVCGSDTAKAELLGQSGRLEDWEQALAVARDWGELRFVHHDDWNPADEEGLPTWVPDIEASDDPDAWHPLDALFAPLKAADGTLVGVLSVDLPEDGRVPGSVQRELLAMFAVQAGIAIENARLSQLLREEHSMLLASEQSFRTAFEGAPVGMTIIGMHGADAGRFLRVNAAMCSLLGYRADQLLAMSFADITHPDDRARDLRALDAAVGGSSDPYAVEKRYLHADGHVVWVSLKTTVVQDEDGAGLYAISQAEDITKARARHEELAHQATHDPLTGLANRTALRERLAALGRGSRRGSRAGALLFCDLDGFKRVNDEHGHAAGDRVLTTVATRLAAQVRAGDVVARLGGDEFVIVAAGMGAAEAEVLATRVADAVAAPVTVDGRETRVTVSIGIVVFPDAPHEGDALVEAADAAMYAAKTSGCGRYAFAEQSVRLPA
jgi:diguanylate cyclase (GGDEF)-like protein/PAS domain S-box-containing protein